MLQVHERRHSIRVANERCDIKSPPCRKSINEALVLSGGLTGQRRSWFVITLPCWKAVHRCQDDFFNCDNYSQRDNVLGFISKGQVTCDDWNLLCIITFPPYLKNGYGMSLTELRHEPDVHRTP